METYGEVVGGNWGTILVTRGLQKKGILRALSTPITGHLYTPSIEQKGIRDIPRHIESIWRSLDWWPLLQATRAGFPRENMAPIVQDIHRFQM